MGAMTQTGQAPDKSYTATWSHVTEGIKHAIEQAIVAAGDKLVYIMGGASIIQQALAAGLVDKLFLHVAPRHAGLPQGAGEQRPVQQVARTYPQPPLRDDVERKACRVLVELPDPRIDLRWIEVRTAQFIERSDDTDVGCVFDVGAAPGAVEEEELADKRPM